MKMCLLVLSLLALTACDTVGFGTSFGLGSDGATVTNTVSGTSGNVSGGLSFDL